MFRASRGDRPGVPNIALVVTDGETNRDSNLTIPEADRARANGITLIAVGIGDSVRTHNDITTRYIQTLIATGMCKLVIATSIGDLIIAVGIGNSVCKISIIYLEILSITKMTI
jgi:hypothetical protein